MNTLFQGSGVALVTPMNEDGSINYTEYEALIEKMIDNHVQALIVNGTTAETPTLSDQELEQLIIRAVKVNKNRVPIIVGTGSNDTKKALQKSLRAKELGANACLIVTPYYNKSSQRGLIEHFTYLADHIGLPIILYNIPGRTGVKINVETAVELSKHKMIIGMKEASGDMSYVVEVISKTKDQGFALYSGEDNLILPFIASGGMGVISVLSNIYPRECQMLCDQILNGEIKKAQQLSADLNEVCNSLFLDVNPICVKAALNRQGICKEVLRLPLVTTTDEIKNKLFNAMDKFERKGY